MFSALTENVHFPTFLNTCCVLGYIVLLFTNSVTTFQAYVPNKFCAQIHVCEKKCKYWLRVEKIPNGVRSKRS